MLACSSRGALPAAPAARQSRPVRRIVAAASPAAVLGSRGSVAARLAQQLRQLKQFKVWDVSAAPSDRCTPDARGGRQLRPARQGAPNDGGARPGAGGGRRPGIVWFRGDLRLHDNDALSRAQADCSSLLPVYCFDPRDYGKSPQGYDRTGPFRAQFLQEAVADLRAALRAAGSELIVRLGKPEEVIGELVRRTGAGAVYCHTEVTYEERRVEAAVKAAAEGAGAQLRAFWGATLAHLEDLPFKLDQLPQSFDGFRERTAGVSPRAALPTPGELRGLPLGGRVDAGEIPTLQQLGLAPLPKGAAPSGSASSSRGSGSGQAKGGEGEALSQLRRFLAHAAGGSGSGSKAAAGAAYTSNFASCIAPWLATGCLSPRRMLEEAQQALGGSGSSAQATAAAASAAQPSGAQAPLSWVRYELLWRDFFRFITLKYSSVSTAALGAKAGGAEAAPSPAQPALAVA
ncbi:blue-light photoreceptor PHR2 [Chlorella sorokiniana]|uniref:Blue-light photoreceptor PHR2 n=1 Tax=Chlorella sorokiniana TaxID=3076 RepID=A0A2P6TW40_CHLSO|nr:blue-light photoreceptor PHR2 [Chlorella sorokiniana]|eukprot:PRW58276.1 blue-light photoreceptor PHR2 [Chlorella sorokiniana]